jgi:S-adenosylmethionine:tRNA-ribosyltransferase-isomerase (queuine synthetase)
MQATHATPLNFRFVSVLVLVSAFAFVSVFAVAASVSFYSFGKATLLIKKLETRN